MASIIRNEGRPAKESLKGGTYVRLHGDLQAQFKAIMRELGFDPESPRADAGVRKVGEMVAAMGLELARACLATGTENLTQYVEKITAGDQAAEEADATPKA